MQPVTGEIIEGLSGNASRPDVRVTNTPSPSQIHLTTESALKKHEQEKKRNYNRRIMNTEHGTFTPLVFSVSGSMGKESSMFHKHVAERLVVKTGERYEKIISTIRCKLMLKSALVLVRGSRSHNLKTIDEFELVLRLARIE